MILVAIILVNRCLKCGLVSNLPLDYITAVYDHVIDYLSSWFLALLIALRPFLLRYNMTRRRIAYKTIAICDFISCNKECEQISYLIMF